ncbi:PepSY domain-containing protein [Thermoflexus sp.]|uniref:PepSY domain-containing protein n=1 Tax=Thermoflexus sp. TaxID=1969742 RepID=UPI0035E45868
MHQQWTYRLAWMLGAFALVILGAAAGRAAQLEWAAAEPTVGVPLTPIADPGTPVAGSNLEQLLQERERAYRALIAEANARLEQAYRQIQELSAQPVASSPDAPAMPSGASVALSPSRVIWIAMNAAPGSALMKEPELVLFQGTLAYEVTLDQGLLYIDASTGQILYDGLPQVVQTAPSAVTQPRITVGKGREREDEDRDDDD